MYDAISKGSVSLQAPREASGVVFNCSNSTIVLDKEIRIWRNSSV